jgi:hypothetical protein
MLTILTGHSFSVDVSSDIFHIYPPWDMYDVRMYGNTCKGVVAKL